MTQFENINKGFNSVFKFGKLSLGLVVPIENFSVSRIPSMNNHLDRVKLAEHLGFKSIWVRDVPFDVPSFGDVGQMFDPFTYLGYIAAHTSDIALGISSIALPLHYPVHVAKSAATIDILSDGRLIMGVASGDRPNEYPAMGIPYEDRDRLFRESFDYIRKANENFPKIESEQYGVTKGDIDILPKATSHKLPMMVTGYSRQSMEWKAEHSDGWMNYPRNNAQQQYDITKWRNLIKQSSKYSKPYLQPLYVDIQEDKDSKPQAIHLGFRIGSKYLNEYLHLLEEIGVNHVALNLRFNSLGTERTLEILAKEVLSQFE